jgi:hypothetical protein
MGRTRRRDYYFFDFRAFLVFLAAFFAVLRPPFFAALFFVATWSLQMVVVQQAT